VIIFIDCVGLLILNFNVNEYMVILNSLHNGSLY